MSDDRKIDNAKFSGELDPEIAELMEISEGEEENPPGFADLFGEGPIEQEKADEVDLSRKTFAPITRFEDKPKPYFADKDYYKKAIGGEPEAQRFHELLSKFLSTQDPKDKAIYRGKVIAAYWNVVAGIVTKVYKELPIPKLLTLRFGLVLPSLLSDEQKTLISKIIFENETGEPLYYMDEWLKKVATGQISSSATDEVKPKKHGGSNQQLLQQIEQAKGHRDVQVGLIRNKMAELEGVESQLKAQVDILCRHGMHPDYEGLKETYTAEQKTAYNEIGNILRQIASIDKDLTSAYIALDNAAQHVKTLMEKAAAAGQETAVDSKVLSDEFNTVRQMIKLCVGRQGNHFPILMKQYFRPVLSEIATRENVLSQLAWVESLDPGIFLRTFKQQTTRIVPHIILVPCYGERGICWEPFERYNRATSRGRVAIPIFPKDVRIAVLAAMADLRWQVAKEKAQHYWMEEGLTGRYYQWFSERKMKGDVREFFINDYILWMTRESEGTQKLDREVRAIFWRYVPFPQALRDSLKTRGFVYSELYKKDINRSMSDGY